MSRLDAIRLADSLKGRLLDFSSSDNFLRDESLQQVCQRVWASSPEDGGLCSDLWVEASTPPMSSGRSLDDLSAEGLICPKLAQQLGKRGVFPTDRPLHWHQHEAVIRAQPTRTPRPAVIVSAGTGAGKTESFLLPVLNQLFKEQRQKHTGCRAIILYPMNALVNDQVDRLYDWMQGQDRITLCHFTSETPEKARSRDRIEYHRCRHGTRQQARGLEDARGRSIPASDRGNPPDILITNYSMLEYMLCRPQDRVFFGKGLRAVVLDEAHLYTGTLAAEMTLLLRRLYDKCGVSSEDVLQFATSATIGTGAPEELQDFAATIFSKPPDQVEVIQGQKSDPSLPQIQPPDQQTDLEELVRAAVDVSTIIMTPQGQEELAISDGGGQELVPLLEQLVASKTVTRYLAEAEGFPARALMALGHAPAMHELDAILREAPQLALTDLSQRLWDNTSQDAAKATALLLSLAASARNSLNDPPLLPHRLHLMLRPSAGFSACCNSECTGRPERRASPLGSLFSSRHDRCLDCGSLALALYRCFSCGYPVLASAEPQGTLRPPFPFEPAGRFFSLTEAEGPPTYIDPTQARLAGRGLPVWTVESCPNCGGARDDFEPMISADSLTISILAETLFSEMPPLACRHEESNAFLPARGRRLLAFSDSRAEAARLGPRLGRAHDRQLVRAAIYRLFEQSPGADPEEIAYLETEIQDQEAKLPSIPERRVEAAKQKVLELRNELRSLREGGPLDLWAERLAEDQETMRQLLDEETGEKHQASAWDDNTWDNNLRKNQDKAAFYLQRELARVPPRPSVTVETIGAVEVVFPGLDHLPIPPEYAGGLDANRRGSLSPVWPDLLAALSDTIRAEQRVTLGTLDEDREWEEGGAPMGHWMTRRQFCGVKSDHRRRRFVSNVLKMAQPAQEPDDHEITTLLEAAFDQLFGHAIQRDADQRTTVHADQLAWLERSTKQHRTRGPEESLRIYLPSLALRKPLRLFRCERSGHVWPRSVLGCAPDLVCAGTLRPITPTELDQTPLVGRQRREYAADSDVFKIGLWAEEHSAQLAPKEARRLQELFRRGMRNLLSATTTLELGIDIGGLSGTFLSNVPPGKANYLQRAGRVGRRADGSSVVVTCARGRPYDREVFRRIGDFLSRPLRQPRVFLDRDRIVRRHFHAWLMGKFFEQLYEPDQHLGAMTAFGRMGSFCQKPYPARWERGMTKQPGLHDAAAPLPDKMTKPAWWQSAKDGLITPFKAWLEHARDYYPAEHWQTLFRATALADVTDWGGLFDAARDHFERVIERWNADYDALLKTWSATDQPAQANSIRYQLLALAETTVIETFSDGRFLPRYGFPIGVHKLRVVAPDETTGKVREEDQYRLERSSLLALREYVPGSQLLVGGKLLTSRGLLKHWTGANLDNALGLRGGLTRCVNHHVYYWLGMDAQECPFCDEPAAGTDSFLLFPQHGFTTAAWDPPKRASDTERVGSVVTATTAFTARAGEHTSHTLKLDPFADIPGLRAHYEEEGEILVYNPGEHKKGFAICTSCGYADSERKDGKKLPSGFETHAPLHEPKREKECWRLGTASHVLRNQLLAAREPTDLVLIDFGHHLATVPDVETVVTSLAVGLHLAGARLLQLDSRELGHMVVPAGPGGSGLGAAVYDNVPGGAGHVLELMNSGRAWLEATRDLLRGTEEHDRVCRAACLDCLMTFDAQAHFARDENALDRRKALRLLDALLDDSPQPVDTQTNGGVPIIELGSLALASPVSVGAFNVNVPDPSRYFVARMASRALDKEIEPGALCLFRRLDADDDLPARDRTVVVSGPAVKDPDLGQVAVRKLKWTTMTDENGGSRKVRVTLRARSSRGNDYPNIRLDIPEAEWGNWRPIAVYERTLED